MIVYLVNRRDVDPVVLSRLLLYLVNAGLGLGHLAWSAHLDVPAAHQYPVHLLQGQLRGLWLLKLHKSEALVFARHRVPAHGDGANGAEGKEGLLDGILPHVVVDTTHVDTAHHGDRLLSLKVLCLLLLVGQGLLHQHHLNADLHGVLLGLLDHAGLVRGELLQSLAQGGAVSLGPGPKHQLVCLDEVSDRLLNSFTIES